jgi:hypothetical protein
MLEPGRIRKKHYHFYFQKTFIIMVIFATISSETCNYGDTFLPLLQNFKKIKKIMVAKNNFHPFFAIIEKNLLP